MPEWLPDTTGLLQLAAGAACVLLAIRPSIARDLYGLVTAKGGQVIDSVVSDRLTIDEAYRALETVEKWGEGRNAEYQQGVRLIADNWLSEVTGGSDP